MTRKRRYSRRSFLAGLGVGAGVIPLLESRAAFGVSATGYPRRLMVLVETNGTVRDSFFPRGAGSDLTRLTLPEITRPLEPYRAELNFFDDNLCVRHLYDTYPMRRDKGHTAYNVLFTGKPGKTVIRDPAEWSDNDSATFDQVIVDRLTARGLLQTPLPKLHLGVQSNHPEFFQRDAFFRGPAQPAATEYSPMRAAAKVFGTAVADPGFERLRTERLSLLDFLKEDITRFRSGVARSDQIKIDAHLSSVRDIEQQLMNLKRVDCGTGSSRMYPSDDQGNANAANHREIMNAHFDLAVAALSCDVTRIVTVQLTNAAGSEPDLVYPWLGLPDKGLQYPHRGNHDIAHNGGPNNADKITIESWYAQQLVALIEKMKAVREGTGTLFDNTAILWANNMGEGAGHSITNLPWIIAGKCGGAFKTGQYVRLPPLSPTHGVLIALANAMGADIQYLDDPRWGGEYTQIRA